MEVVFSPTGGGSRRAALAFTTNDADEPAVSLPLGGTAVAQGITVQSVTLSNVPTGLVGGDRKAKVSASVVLRNEGETDVSGPVVVELFASTSGSVAGGSAISIGRVSKNQKLKIGAASKPVRIKLTIPVVPAEGDYLVIAQATGAGILGTASAQTGTLTIEQPVVDVFPNSVLPVSLKVGRGGTFSLNVTNRGNTMAKGSIAAELFFTTGGTVDSAVASATSTLKVGLKPAASKTLRGRVIAPASLAPGSYTLVVRVSAIGSLGAPNLSDLAAVSAPVTIAL